jgi:hypothetical protein
MTYGDPLPDTDPPFFFVRRWSSLTIFGRQVEVSYAEDKQHVADLERRGMIFTESFSMACIEGELGSHPLATCTPISREQFMEAKSRDWSPW